MKKLLIVLTISFLIGAIAYPALARGPGWGRGTYPGYGGPCRDYAPQQGNVYGNLTDEQRSGLDKLYQKFYDETVQLRNEIGSKSIELNNLLRSSDPDTQKIRSLNKEISDLRARLGEKRLDFDLEARKIMPQGSYYGKGYGKGYARFMQGRGHGPGMGNGPKRGYAGYGPGYCR